MKARAALLCAAGMALLLSGCWSKMELTERAFVLGLAIDEGGEDRLEVTVQIYKPSSQFGSPTGLTQDEAFINVTLDGSSLSNIIRNTKTVTGRHSQFSHIQIILISEDVAKKRLGSILDFFNRDPEIRLVTAVMIAKGKARDYLTGKSLIENTLGSQVFKQLDFSYKMAGRSVNTTLLDLAFQLKSESASAMLPVITHDKKFGKNIVHGIALAHPDRVVGRINPEKAPYLLLLAGKYKYGVLEIPCGGEGDLSETIEVLESEARITPVIEGDSVSARIRVNIAASVGELACTTIRDLADETRFADMIGRHFKEQMESVLAALRERKADVLGIGHKIYVRDPSRWKKLKPDWPERYARLPIELEVRASVLNSKMMLPGPFSRIDDH